jgi:hypothetical protein
MSRIKIDFGSVAKAVGIGNLWPGGSKQPAIQALLEGTLQSHRDKFCVLMQRIVQEGLKYRHKKGEPITREEIEKLNSLILRVRFKIPELVDEKFLSTLPRKKPVAEEAKKESKVSTEGIKDTLVQLKQQFLKIGQLSPQERGYAFERFLSAIFDAFGFNPRPSFRIMGEQIDGSIEFAHEYYLIEAKWQMEAITQADLLILDGRVSGHSGIGRGIYVTAGCFSPEGVAAYERLRPSSMIGIDGQDLYFVLDEGVALDEVLRRKFRWLVETGGFHYPVSKFKAEIRLK